MDSIFGFALFFVLLVIVGILFALVARIPPIRRRARRNRTFRIGLTISTTLAALMSVYAVMLSLGLSIGIIFSSLFIGGTTFDGSPMMSASPVPEEVEHELWLQYLYFSNSCFSQNAAVCDEAAALFERMGGAEGRLNTAFISLFMASISAFSAMYFTWRITRKAPKQKRDVVDKAKNDFSV